MTIAEIAERIELIAMQFGVIGLLDYERELLEIAADLRRLET